MRSILSAYVLSRGLVFLLLIAGSQISFLTKDYGGTVWRTEIRLSAERIRPELTRMVMAGDAWWYRRIATSGYETASGAKARETWAFFPLFPLLVRALDVVSDFAITAVVLSNLAFLAALFAIAAVIVRLGGTDDIVDRAVFFLCFFPTSYFFSLPMTESLFLLLTALSFLAALNDRWLLASLLGAAASATRSFGILLLPALLFLPLQRGQKLSARHAWLALVPGGLLLFMLFLHLHAGDPIAFVHAQRLWGRHGLSTGLTTPGGIVLSRPWNFVALNLAAAALLLVAGIDMLRRRLWSYAVYILGSLALPIFSGSLQSLARYSAVVFPLFIWLAMLTEERRRERLVAATLVFLLAALVTFFVLRVDFAMA